MYNLYRQLKNQDNVLVSTISDDTQETLEHYFKSRYSCDISSYGRGDGTYPTWVVVNFGDNQLTYTVEPKDETQNNPY